MKIKINFLPLSILIVVFLHSTLYSQGLAERKWANSAKIELISADNYETTIKVSISDFDMNDVQTQRGIAKKLILKNAYPFIEKDAPELLKVSVSVAIPFGAEMEAEVISKQYTDFQNILVAPSKGNLTRDINPSSVPYNFGKIYQLNEFYPNKLTELQSPYIMRDITGQALSVYPFQYNPQTKVLRVFNELIIKIKPSSSSNILASNKQINKVDSEFEKIYLKHFINYPFLKTKYTPVSENGKMLIICPDMFMSAIQPLVDWRRISGTPTEVVDISTIGATTTAIKNYISNYYNTNGLTYVILVGDAPQIPTFTVSGGGSDNTYSYLVGNDHYPDIFVGRISAENITHVQTQVQKILSYEIYPQSNDGWLNRGIGIASQEGPGDNNEYDYQHVRSMRQDLLNYEYVSMSELYEGNQGGMDANGDPTAAMVSDEVNNGASIILYTGHGSNTSWGTTGFSNTNINSLTNYNKWPFIWAVACVNGNFTSTTCFAEAWLRATNNGQPTGAIATLMSTINQSWNPPMCGQDEMVDILTEQVNGNIKRSFGAISMHGCMKMNDVYGTQGDEMTDTWNIFGDPSLFVRTDTAKTMNISHSNIALLGATSVQIQCNTNDAKVTLSINGNAIASEFVVNNNAVLNFSPLTQLDSIKVVVTAYNKIPYIGYIQVIVPNGPFVQFENKVVRDNGGNNNQQADINEVIDIDVTLKNIGVAAANGVNATISTSDTNVQIINASCQFGSINQGSSLTVQNAFKVKVKNNYFDQHQVTFNMTITDNSSNTWNNNFSLTLNAPNFEIGNVIVKDTINGNFNSFLDSGEVAVIAIPVINNGHSQSAISNSELIAVSNNVTIQSANVVQLPSINENDLYYAIYQIKVNSVAPGSLIEFQYNINAGFHSYSTHLYFNAGLNIEDFETNNFLKYNWVQGGNAPWTITSVNPYQGLYSAKSGAIGNSKTTSIAITVNVAQNDSISFIKKVSCEASSTLPPSYDYLDFQIDNVSVGKWHGEVNWSLTSFPVSQGIHTFKWIYRKDSYQTAGSDCVWLDNIKLPKGIISKEPLTCTLTALNDTICQNYSTKLILNYSGGVGGNVITWSANPQYNNPMTYPYIVSPDITTTFTANIKDAGNSTVNSSYTINVKPSIIPVITQVGNQLISSEPENLWYDDNGLIAGANGNSFTPTYTSHFYATSVNSNGCISQASNVIYVAFAGINEGVENDITVYPNPFSDVITIKSDKNFINKNMKITIFNSLGQEIKTELLFSENNIVINASNFERGVYFIKLSNNGNSLVKKLIKTI
jgi:hypothetical protein